MMTDDEVKAEVYRVATENRSLPPLLIIELLRVNLPGVGDERIAVALIELAKRED